MDIYRINGILQNCKNYYISNNNNTTIKNLNFYNMIISKNIYSIYKSIDKTTEVLARREYIFKIMQSIVYQFPIDVNLKELYIYINDCLIQCNFIKMLKNKQKKISK